MLKEDLYVIIKSLTSQAIGIVFVYLVKEVARLALDAFLVEELATNYHAPYPEEHQFIANTLTVHRCCSFRVKTAAGKNWLLETYP